MSKILSRLITNCLAVLVMPAVANAAGTYYTGAVYQPTQYRYGQSGTYATSGYGNGSMSSMASTRYTPGYSGNYQSANTTQPGTARTAQKTSQPASATTKSGFYANGGITHEKAMWQFEMTNAANSILRYDNIGWNVLDLNGGYVFDAGGTKMQVDAGFKYGMQWGEGSMIDDDISNGGYGVSEFWVDTDADDELDTLVGSVAGHGLSIGKSKDGNMLGFNVGFGLTDFMKWGGLKITPSVGYRYLRYKLETSDNYGMLMDTVNTADGCIVSGDEMQCGVALVFYYNANNLNAVIPANGLVQIPTGAAYIDANDTYYYAQAGVSHSYEVEWSGPYIALDMLYDINQNNSVNARVELGFPGYTATGDQPYRWDWAHPKSVEDNAGMFSGFHLGLAADWQTALSDRVSLSLGLTYDYYTVSGADTETHLNESLYNQLVASNPTDATSLWMIDQLEAKYNACGSWTCKSSNEIDSIYKSMGIRVGLAARF